MRLAAASIVSLLLVQAPGCARIFEPDWTREIGWVIEEELPPGGALVLPETVRRNVPVTATVITRGSSSCTRADGAEVERIGDSFRITPYDRMAPPGTPCTRDLAAFPRPVELRFTAAGEMEVIVVGRSSPRGDPLEIRYPVTVLP